MSRTTTIRTYPRLAYESIENFRNDTKVNHTFAPISIETAYKEFGEIELINIQYNNTDQNHLKHINDVIIKYADCLMLVKDSVITVFTRKTECQEKIIEKSDHIPYTQLDDSFSKDKTFGVYSNPDGVRCVLLEKTHFALLSKLDTYGKRSTSVVTINIEDITRERKIKSAPTDVLVSENTPSCQTRAVNISLSQYRQVNQHDHEKVVLPRERYESYRLPRKLLSEAVVRRDVFYTFPILEASYSRPGVLDDARNLPDPALPEVSLTAAVQTSALSAQANGTSQVQYSKYMKYEDRLTTFGEWGTRKPEPECLSKAGFFFTGKQDLVRCFTCGLGLKDFTDDIEPINEHVRHSDQCPFLSEWFQDEQKLEAIKKKLRAFDPEYNRRAQRREPRKFKHPDYQTVEARISSFAKWPLKLSHSFVAESGLYYTGFDAVVRCFACDGGFRKLKSTENLWLDHCFYFPSCIYMKMKLGLRFIKLVHGTIDEIEDEEAKESEAVVQRLSEEIHPGNRHYRTGLQVSDLENALKQLISRGDNHNAGPVLDLLEEKQVKKESSPLREKLEAKLPDYRQEQNEIMRKIVHCNTCKEKANALFLPCGHHKYCTTCAEHIEVCPICGKNIRQKAKTFS